MVKTFKYRLYPTKEQTKIMRDTCFLCSLAYNRCLAERKEAYESEGRSLSAYEQIKTLPHKKSGIYPAPQV
jgi:putative transposase